MIAVPKSHFSTEKKQRLSYTGSASVNGLSPTLFKLMGVLKLTSSAVVNLLTVVQSHSNQ